MRIPARRLACTWLLSGLLIGALGCQEQSDAPTAPGLDPAMAVSALAVTFSQVNAGGTHSCALVADGRAFCWGSNSNGQLGDGTLTRRTTPVAVAGRLRFAQISAGARHTCAVTTDNRAYCWGDNGSGRLGEGGGVDRWTPTAVAGGRKFVNVRAGYNHTCAVTPAGAGFCWGSNGRGQLGSGPLSGTSSSGVPVRVARGLEWRRISAGGHFSCGVTTANVAYCWGSNINGQLGTGTQTNHPKPAAVAGGLRFREISTGGGGFTDLQQTEIYEAHACGVTTDDKAYCWGWGGAVGDGTWDTRRSPTAVAGNRRWKQVVAGFVNTCGVTRADVAFCWGGNYYGQIGNGTTSSSLSPARVAGDLRFLGVSVGVEGAHSCGRATDQRTYCWGRNSTGQLGDGTVADRATPVAVADPS
ncbi:hypothetical protein BH24GEM1_BH24GEM1_01920 [soil metagenome]